MRQLVNVCSNVPLRQMVKSGLVGMLFLILSCPGLLIVLTGALFIPLERVLLTVLSFTSMRMSMALAVPQALALDRLFPRHQMYLVRQRL